MGKSSRKKAAREFDVRIVIARYLEVIDSTIGAKPVVSTD